jgi:hypothetical protein
MRAKLNRSIRISEETQNRLKTTKEFYRTLAADSPRRKKIKNYDELINWALDRLYIQNINN